MKTYTVLWTYVGNYSNCPTIVEANSPEEAIEKVSFYDPEACNFIVIEGVPVLETARVVYLPTDDGNDSEIKKVVRIDYKDPDIVEELKKRKETSYIAAKYFIEKFQEAKDNG